MVDTPDSKSCELYARDGSSPSSGTKLKRRPAGRLFICISVIVQDFTDEWLNKLLPHGN